MGLGQELRLAVGSQGSTPGWTTLDDVRVRHRMGPGGGSSCFEIRGVLTFHSTGGLNFEHKVSREPV